MIRLCLIALVMGVSYGSLAQEASCGDGVDNDGDGFIDCFDGDCANNPACDDSYIGKDKLCQTPPTGSLLFGMKLGATSRNQTTLSYGRMVVGDLDRDGIPEMVTTHHNDKKVYILNGDDLSIKTEITTIGNPEYFDHAIANLDDDNCAEIFIVESEVRRECDSRGRNCRNNTYYMVTSFDCNGNQLWRTQSYGQPFTIGLADFDHDGQVELYYKNEILDARTGEVLVPGSGNWNAFDSGPVAVDMLPDGECAECAGLELILGGEIFAVDLSPRIPGGGSVGTAIRRFNDLPGLGGITYYPKYVGFGYVNSMTSVADYNLDGNLDVIMNGATSSSATSTTTVFFWDVANNEFKSFQPKQPNGSSWPHGTGRINVADVDGDGKMNATFVSGARIYSLKEDFTLLWQKTIAEQTSGFTSTTVFDFNNDNAVEIVYRDEANLYIIDGKTGNAFTTVVCRSRTANDYPIVVDVDADGATEICVSCATNDNTDISNNGNTRFGQIRTYKSSLEPWVSARKVWNQYAYFNVNVNDDLTIPQVQQKHHLVFSEDVCGAGENRALNSFLNQSAILDSKGCKTYPSADVAFLANPSLLNVVPPTCPDQDFIVSFTLQNIGDLDLNGDFPITFYKGDPRLAGATKLTTKNITFTNFRIGGRIDVTNMPISGTGGTFELFAVLNDNGSTVPTPISFPNSGFMECNFSNNIVSASVNPIVFPLAASSSDHVQCGAEPSPPNGSMRAFKTEGAVEQTVGYTFYWFDGTTAGAPATADHVGSQINNILNGTYTVYAIHDAYRCGSDTVQVVVGQQSLSIGATVGVDKSFTNCKHPDGQLSVTPDTGSINDYTYEWFEGTVFGTSPSLSHSNVLGSARAQTYSVLVTQISSGCETLESATVPDLTVTPSVSTASTAANCTPASSGMASANVAGATGGYTFYWYDGSTAKPTEDFRGHTYSNIQAGNYTVVVEDNSTGCRSGETVVTVPVATNITVTARATAEQTSCSISNGAATASVGGVTTGYTFRWFRGNNTVHQVGDGPSISGLAAGLYTVEATSTTTGCVDTEVITIVDNIRIPIATPTVVTDQVICFPAGGALHATATGSPGPYAFYWFDGNVGSPDTTSADFKGGSYTGLAAGFYTVVAVDISNRCVSPRRLIQVRDETVAPALMVVTKEQTSCNPLQPNGGASANVGGVTAGYKFRWFAGTDTTSFITQQATLSGRAAGTYTVKAVNSVTGCFSIRQLTLTNNSVTPVVSAVVDQNVTLCNANNGQVSANVAGATEGFDFYWFNGNPVVTDSASANFEGAVWSARSVGSYTVIAVGKATRCVSARRTLNVADNTVVPVITTSTINQTSCNPLTPNGQASAHVGGITAGYKFRWFAGADTTIFITQTSTLKNRAAGTYTVKAMHAVTGCFSTGQVTITNNPVSPVVTAVVDRNLTLCNASNGEVSANVAGATAGYDFYWFNGNAAVTDSTAADYEGAVWSARPVGSYTVIAVRKTTRCVSLKRSVKVTDDTVFPVISTSTANQTSCNALAPNGRAVADVGGATAGYKFRWFAGADTTPFITQASILTGRAAGTFTVKAVDLVTGCSSTRQVTIINNFVTPIVNATVDQNLTLCNTRDGQVSASVAGATAGFDFYWFNGNPALTDSASSVFEGAVWPGRPVGSHTVIAVDKTTRCASVKRTVNVTDMTVPPAVVALSPNPNTACDPALSDGSISANVEGVITDHIFHIFKGQNTNPVNEVAGSPAATIASLAAGVYTVQAIDIATGCSAVTEVTIDNNIVLPTLHAVSSSVRNCAPVDGSITANVDIGVPSDYTFTWYAGNRMKVATDFPGQTTEQLYGLTAGTYTVSAVNNKLGCDVEKPFVINVGKDPGTAITITDVPGDLIPGSFCNNGDGQLGAQAFSPVNTSGFSFSWFAGDKNSGMIFKGNGTAISPTHNKISSILSGRYTVIALDNDTGCQDSLAIDLPYVDEASIATLNISPQTDCATPDGSFETMINPGPIAAALGATQASYRLDVFQNGTLIRSVPGVDPGPTLILGLSAGAYTVVAVETQVPPLTGCSSKATDILINDATLHPVIDAAISENKNCVGTSAENGSITLSIDGGAEPNDYAFDWHQGKFISDPALPVAHTPLPHNAAINIDGGFYTVEAVNKITGCATVETFHVTDDPYVISILNADLIVTHQTDCAPENGSAEITDVQVDGTPGGLAGFTFQWFESDGTSVVPLSGTTPVISTTLNFGSYYVQATSTASNCRSTLKQFDILDQTQLPVVAATSIIDNSNCAGIVPNGSVSIDVNAGANPISDFTIEWFEGTGTSIPLGTNTGITAGMNHELALELPAGTYTVRVIDNSTPGNSCAAASTFTINNDLPVLAIDHADIAITHQTDCSPLNGSAQIMGVSVNGVTSAVAGFTFEWLASDGSTVISGSGNGSAIGVTLGAGNYFVRGTSLTSGCISPMTSFTIKGAHVDPMITSTAIVNNSNCAESDGNGSITIQVNAGVDPVNDFVIGWFEGTGTAVPLGTNVGTMTGINNDIAQGLPAGTYTVRVTDKMTPGNGCEAISTFTISDDLPVIGIHNPDIAISHQTDCSPLNGAAQITDVFVNGVSTGVGNFTFEWLASDATTMISGAGNGATIGIALGAGNYFVRATSLTSSCVSPVTGFTINDAQVVPAIGSSVIVNNTNCTGASPNGSVMIQLNGGIDPITDFTIEWFEGSGTAVALGTNFGITAGVNNEIIRELPAGMYTVRVTDNTSPGNSCGASATFRIVDDFPVVTIDHADIAVTHKTDCAPANGDAFVREITINGAGIGNTADYIFNWLHADAIVPVTGTGETASPGVPLLAGQYVVRAKNRSTSCWTPATPFTIEDRAPTPAVDIVMNSPNVACDNNFTGALSVSVTEGTASSVVAGYTFDWFTGKNNTSPADFISSGVLASSLQQGDYTVLVTDTSSPGLGCIATATAPVKFQSTHFTSTLRTVMQAHCAPALDGSLTVDNVTESIAGVSTSYSMTNAADRDRFGFQWFDQDLNPLPVTPVAVNGFHAINNMVAGQYYVMITNSMGCSAALTGGIIDDLTVAPVITLGDFQNPAVCVMPETSGYLQVSADNSLNFADYTFEWFEGADANGTRIESDNAALSNIRYGQPLQYTVRVTNKATNCMSSETYRFSIDTVDIQVLASAVARTNCLVDDGSLFATTLIGSGAAYSYAWYSGPTPTDQPIYTTREVSGVPVGEYTVVASNPNHSFCASAPLTTTVTDARVLPNVVATQRNPLTYCDPANPNGVALASVTNAANSIIFDWFAGSIDGASLYTGTEATGLRSATYVVRATDALTGCYATASISIDSDPVNVPEPLVTVISHHTNCVDADGILSASVDGNTADYLLQWYDGHAVKKLADATGEFYRGLEDGFYATTATDKQSGCVSDPVVTEVLPFRELPEFEVVTVPTNCEQNIGEATVVLKNEIQLSAVEWNIAGDIQFGTMLSGLPKGEFTVRATTHQQCFTEKIFIIYPEVLVFNGVSRNNDGKNDYFEIACIQDFPDNNVKVFNRAGTLVYEANGYDNQEVFFNGVSNRGLSLLGTDLPDGTYFYIIDKGDGSEPRSGYLELLR